MNKSETIKEIAGALAVFHKEVATIKKTETNPFFKSKYADLSNILDSIKEPLEKAGLVFSQIPSGENELTTILIHTKSGEWMSGAYKMTPAKNDPQGQGSAITYMRRYALSAILGLNTDEDDDGNRASTANTSQRAKTAPRSDANAKVCSLCGSEAKVSPKSGKDYCPNWNEPSHKGGAFYKIINPADKSFEDSLPVIEQENG